MKGIILSGGMGTRMRPLTYVTSKQLLPVYDKPMIFYPLNTLLRAGIKEILIILDKDHCGDYLKVLGSGKEFGPGVKFTYELQDNPKGGIGEAFIIAENFLDDGDNATLILGDNIFEQDFTEDIASFKSGARAFAIKVPDPERLGQIKFNESGKALDIQEKTDPPISPYAIPGIYIVDNRCVEIAKTTPRSARGEIEISSGILKWYLDHGELDVKTISGEWIDAGTFESLFRANQWAREQARGGKDIL